MITLDDIPALVADVESGELLWWVACDVLVRMLGDHDAEEVVARLPPSLRAKFVAELRDSFDNDTDADAILWVDNAGEPANKVQIIESARRWLAKHCDA